MAQKILAGRTADPTLSGDVVEVKVDQIVLARAPRRALAEGLHAGLRRTSVEVAIAYETTAVTGAGAAAEVPLDAVAHGLLVAKAGAGFPSMVHLERFAAPARLCVTDDPRLAAVGGIGMLSLVVPPGLLGQALARGSVWLRPPRSVQVLLSGKLRPFVCARDVSLELVRRGLGEAVRRVEDRFGAPVVLEFSGQSARLLSVAERGVLAGLAPQLGAAGALFPSDERTSVFLRDQRRSKAHRVLVADAGAPCDEVVNVDLGAVDPLLLDDTGAVRAVRDLSGRSVSQVVLGGDSGVTLRDLFAAAALLKSKRVPSRLDFLLAVPSRQMLEALATSGALADLIATGARVVEPDARVVTGQLYPAAPGGLTLRTADPEPRTPAQEGSIVASAETLAYAVASGTLADPRSFKRPVRVTVPRALPTDDVLLVRDRKASEPAARNGAMPSLDAAVPWRGGQVEVVAWRSFAPTGTGAVAVLCAELDEVREVAARAADLAPSVRAVVAPFIPSGIVAVLSGLGIAALRVDAGASASLAGTATLPASWPEREPATVQVGDASVPLQWLARSHERAWAGAGAARTSPVPVPRASRPRL
jgi:aconitate hydratase